MNEMEAIAARFFESWSSRFERACSDAMLTAGCDLAPDEYAEVCARLMTNWFFGSPGSITASPPVSIEDGCGGSTRASTAAAPGDNE